MLMSYRVTELGNSKTASFLDMVKRLRVGRATINF